MAESFSAIISKLSTARNVAILTHQRPDADAIGCQLGMAMLLKQMGKNVCIMQDEAPPPTLAFMHEDLSGAQIGIIGKRDLAQDDTLLVVDTSVYSQLESARSALLARKEDVVVIDHHLSHDDMAAVMYTDTTAAACAEIVVEFAHAVNMPLTPAMAKVLMCGLVGDCGWFRFDSVTPRTHRIAGELISFGAKPAELYELLVQTEQPAKLALMQRALASIVYRADFRIAAMTVTQKDFADAQALPSHTEGLVNIPLDVATVQLSVLLTEMPDGRIRGSLRSKGHVDVNKIANQFGGGGHAKAAGLKLDCPIAEAREHVLRAMEKAL